MRNYFEELVKIIKSALDSNEEFTVWFSAEHMDYARFNHAAIRQAGTVEQYYAELSLIKGLKHSSINLALAKNVVSDKEALTQALKDLREKIAHSNDDPYLMLNKDINSSEHIGTHELQDKNFCIDSILKESAGLDLVGSYVGGPIYRGFANSFGQFNWFEKSSFVLDTSVYYSGDKAIKQSYCASRFDQTCFRNKMAEARLGLELYKKDSLIIKPGEYKVYFAPAAVHELLGMLNWSGFSRKALEVKNSPLMPLFTFAKQLSVNFSLSENIACGIGPDFQSQGFIKQAQTPIITNGKLANTLISPKTAQEYGLLHNGADDSESLCSMDLACGTLEEKDILNTLQDGLYINNLWYLNFSDRQNGCLTGMTRFLCFVVKNGSPLAPFSVMRFDDSIYRIFGSKLLLTKNREMIIDNSTYDERSTSCAILPGIIAENVRFTL